VRLDSWVAGYAVYEFSAVGYTIRYYQKGGIATETTTCPKDGNPLKTEAYDAAGALLRIDYHRPFNYPEGFRLPGEWTRLTYNHDGTLQERVFGETASDGTESPTRREQYAYAADRSIKTVQEREHGVWKTEERTTFFHDATGNTVRHERRDDDGRLEEWAEYEPAGEGLRIVYHKPEEEHEAKADDPVTKEEVYNRNGDLVARTTYRDNGMVASLATFAPPPVPGDDLLVDPESLTVRFDILLDYDRPGTLERFDDDCTASPSSCEAPNAIWAAYLAGDAIDQLDDGLPDEGHEIRAYNLAGGPYGESIVTRDFWNRTKLKLL